MGARYACVVAIAWSIGCGSPRHEVTDGNLGDSSSDATPGMFGDPCTHHTECESGYCVEPGGGAGGHCSRTCNDDCPTGWDCLPVDFPEGTVRVCVQATGRLCALCATDGECPGGSCLAIDNSTRCATTCASQANCPDGYVCAADPASTHPGMFCQPTLNSCTCAAEDAGDVRTCVASNNNGTCTGTQTCGASGWSICTAPAPAPETCDGIDNDCNFVVDNDVGGGEACMNTNGFGSCPGVRTCNGAAGFVCNGPTPAAETCNALDDNCNGSIDETFPGLGTLCSQGVGACLRYGTVRCNTLGTGTECSAVAAMPTAEMCNQVDDNCNGSVDEPFTTLGQQCSAGVGVCTRYGTFVCRADGTGTACTATAGMPTGPETCNYLDDNCDGSVDNGFRDPITGIYNTDTNCGACGNNCTTAIVAPNASGACVVAGTTASCGLRCNAGYFDLNASAPDGCEFLLDVAAIHVSTNDMTSVDDATCGLGPTGTGAGNHPCKTITFGLARATSTGRAKVFVADGTYNEAVTLVAGKSLLGGYRADTWERHLSTTSTVIQGAQATGNHDSTVIANNITTTTLFEGFIVRGSFNTKAGGNSYAVYIAGSNAMLTIQNNQIFAGRGGAGAAGPSGINGTAGVNGAVPDSTYDSFQVQNNVTGQCNAAVNRSGIGGGVRTCPVNDDVGGGNGGGNNCTPALDTQNSTASFLAVAGQPGVLGGAAGAPGSRGYDAELQMRCVQVNIFNQCVSYSRSCIVPCSMRNGSGACTGTLLSLHGTDGAPGGSGLNAAGVGGCSAAGGSVVGGHWAGGAALSGILGTCGGGGGGGGSGGGSKCNGDGVYFTFCGIASPNNYGTNKDMLGARGGGGATGGCGGNGGGAGGAGGGVFGIFITGGAAPTIANNVINMGAGGVGGAGGIGGAGGLGGTGGAGGQLGKVGSPPADLFCTGKGGRGGDGGNGGAGSGGGGGCGGSSFGVFTQGIGSPTYCASNTVSGGSAGTGGTGGYSPGNSGGNGAVGVVNGCTSI